MLKWLSLLFVVPGRAQLSGAIESGAVAEWARGATPPPPVSLAIRSALSSSLISKLVRLFNLSCSTSFLRFVSSNFSSAFLSSDFLSSTLFPLAWLNFNSLFKSLMVGWSAKAGWCKTLFGITSPSWSNCCRRCCCCDWGRFVRLAAPSKRLDVVVAVSQPVALAGLWCSPSCWSFCCLTTIEGITFLSPLSVLLSISSGFILSHYCCCLWMRLRNESLDVPSKWRPWWNIDFNFYSINLSTISMFSHYNIGWIRYAKLTELRR